MPIFELTIVILSFLAILFSVTSLIVTSISLWELGYRFLSVLNFILIFFIILLSCFLINVFLN